MRQPDHQPLVRGSIPSRIAEALSVNAFRRPVSRHIAYRIGVSATNAGYLTQVNKHPLLAALRHRWPAENDRLQSADVKDVLPLRT
jgi:hypothetical protein